MTLISISAKVACDACGELFHIDIDPAAAHTNGFEAAIEGMKDGITSYEDGIMRCQPCTAAADRRWIAEHPSFIQGVTPTGSGWSVTTYDNTVLFVPVGHRAGEPKYDIDATPFMAPVEQAA